jgi:hypothetical protein
MTALMLFWITLAQAIEDNGQKSLICEVNYTETSFTVALDLNKKTYSHSNLVTNKTSTGSIEVTPYEIIYAFKNDANETEYFRISRSSLGVSHAIKVNGEQRTGGYGGCSENVNTEKS